MTQSGQMETTLPSQEQCNKQRSNKLSLWLRWFIVIFVLLVIIGGTVLWIIQGSQAIIPLASFTALGLLFTFIQVFTSLFPGKDTGATTTLIKQAVETIEAPMLPPSPDTKVHLQLHAPDDLHRGLKIDWGNAPRGKQFYGREKECAILKKWIVDEHCQLIAIQGLGGMGKTSIAAKVSEQTKDDFDYIFWRSLESAPSIKSTLQDCIQFVSDQQNTNLPDDVDLQIALLLQYLQKRRCLIILDNFESVLKEGVSTGDQYREGYEGYGKLIQSVGEIKHCSCLLLTSRENTGEIARLEGTSGPVRFFPLQGIGISEAREILNDKGLTELDDTSIGQFLHSYSGNPLCLTLVPEIIRSVFGGSVTSFLKHGKSVVGNTITGLLNNQFSRLSTLEQDILYWLAIERETVSLAELHEDIIHSIAEADIHEAIISLRRRSMIEHNDTEGFKLQPAIMEYVTYRLVQRVCQEFVTEKIELLASHALIKAQAKDYIRDSQILFILLPVAYWLDSTLGPDGFKEKLRNILASLRREHAHIPSYAAGNILNLLIQSASGPNGYDFSQLPIWQAYCRGKTLQHVNFSHANFVRSAFTDTFGNVPSVAFSPDGELLAAGTDTMEIWIWQVRTGMPLVICQGHTDWLRSIAFSPDGTLLASGSDDGTVRIWQVSSGQCLAILSDHTNWVWSVAFSSDGKLLASGDDDQVIRFWQVSNWQCLKILRKNTQWIDPANFNRDESIPETSSRGHTGSIVPFAFSPDGQYIAVGSTDRVIRIWAITTEKCLRTLQDHTGIIRSIAFSSDGTTIASSGDDQTVRLWRTDSDQCFRILEGHTSQVVSIALSPDGKTIVSAGGDQIIRLWHISSGQCFKTLQGHTQHVYSLAISPDGQTIASGGHDQSIRLWHISSGQCFKLLQGYINWILAVAISSDGQTIVSGSADQTVRLWQLNSGQCIQKLTGHAGRIRSVTFSPDKMLVASGSEDGTVRLWHSDSGEPFRTLYGHSSWVSSVRFSPDGTLLASSGRDQTVRIWQVRSGHCLKILREHTSWVWDVAFSPDGALLASSCDDGIVHLWQVDSGQRIKILDHNTDKQTRWVWGITFNPDGTLLATGCDDARVRLWQVESGQCLKILQGHTNWVRSVVFNTNGKLLASSSDDRTVRLWDTQTGDCLQTLQGHTSDIWSIAFNPEGDMIISGSLDGTIKLWNIQTGICLKTIKAEGPYAGTNIIGATGLTSTQKSTLKTLGAIENAEQHVP